MDFKVLRSIHLYLGTFFAPMLILFVISGVLQVFHLHHDHKNGYKAPQLIEDLSEIHTQQRLDIGQAAQTSKPFQYFTVFLSVAFIFTTITGIMMALKFARPAIVWLVFLAGLCLPLLLLYWR